MIDIGIDIGSVSVKVAVVGDKNDRRLLDQVVSESDSFFSLDEGSDSLAPNGKCIIVSEYKRIKGMPVHSTYELLDVLYKHIPDDKIRGIRVTGAGGKLLSQLLDVPLENDFRTASQGVGILYPDVSTIFEMGGENSKYISINVDKDEGVVGIVDYEKNGECAAGTGSFMDQQATRLQCEIEDVGTIVMGAGKAANIAGRCSVFAKSDMIHAQQKGIQTPEILKGLCDAVVRNFKGTIVKNRKLAPKTVFIGGVAANKGVVQAMQSLFELSDEDFFVPGYYAWMSAIGAAFFNETSDINKKPKDIHVLATHSESEEENMAVHRPLSMEKVTLLRDKVKPYSFDDKTGIIDAYLGIDVGSVSTNLVAVDDDGDVIMEIYVPTEGNPIDVLTKNLRKMGEEIGDKIRVRGVGTTGSGRELAGVWDADDTDGRVKFVKEQQDEKAAEESIIVCQFAYGIGLLNDILPEMVSISTGENWTLKKMRLAGERIWNLSRIFNLREGITRDDDYLPEKFAKEGIKKGPLKGKVMSKSKQDYMLDKYYEFRGWSKNGAPLESTLKRLEIEDLI